MELPNEMILEFLNKFPKTIKGFKERQRIISSIPNYNRNLNRIWYELGDKLKNYDYRIDYQEEFLEPLTIKIADKQSINAWANTVDIDLLGGISQKKLESLFFDILAKNYQDVIIPTQTSLLVDKKLNCKLTPINFAFVLAEIMCFAGIYRTENQSIFDHLDYSHRNFYPFINSELLKDIYDRKNKYKNTNRKLNIVSPKFSDYFYYSLYVCTDSKRIDKLDLNVWDEMLEDPNDVNDRVFIGIEDDFKMFKNIIKFNNCEETDFMLE